MSIETYEAIDREELVNLAIYDFHEATDRGELPDPGSGDLTNDRHSRQIGHYPFEQFEPLYANAKFKGGKTGDVSSRPGQAINKSRGNRIGHPNEDNWHGLSRLL